jgi:hypothetical protein
MISLEFTSTCDIVKEAKERGKARLKRLTVFCRAGSRCPLIRCPRAEAHLLSLSRESVTVCSNLNALIAYRSCLQWFVAIQCQVLFLKSLEREKLLYTSSQLARADAILGGQNNQYRTLLLSLLANNAPQWHKQTDPSSACGGCSRTFCQTNSKASA